MSKRNKLINKFYENNISNYNDFDVEFNLFSK